MRGNQLKRQWQLLQILQNYKYGIVIEELVKKVEYCRRTVERDLNILREIGFPISFQTDGDGKKRWRLESNFLSTDKFIVEPTELVSLYLARQFISPFQGTPLFEGLDKLWNKIEKLLPQKALTYFTVLEDQIYVKPNASVVSPQNFSILVVELRRALEENKITEITYKVFNPDRDVEIVFHPYGMVFAYGNAYLIGFSEYAKEIRTLKLQRIKSVKVTGKTFIRPDDFNLGKYIGGSFGIFASEGKQQTIRCRFTGWAAQLVREQKFHKTQVIEKEEGETLTASFLLNSSEEFIGWVLGFGAMAKVLEPKSLQKQILERLQQAAKLYTQ